MKNLNSVENLDNNEKTQQKVAVNDAEKVNSNSYTAKTNNTKQNVVEGEGIDENSAKCNQNPTVRSNSLKWGEFIKYTLFSISAGIIQISSFALLNEVLLVDISLEFRYWVAYLPALTLSVAWNFTFNRKFTFKSANNIPVAMLKVAGYYAVFIPLSTFIGNLLDRAHVYEYLILIGTMLVNFGSEFFYSKFLVFSPRFDKKK